MKILLRYTILLLVFICLQVKEASAATCVWVGGISSNWTTPGNWFGGAAPSVSGVDDVTIGLTQNVTTSPVISSGTTVSCRSIKFGALLPIILTVPTMSLTVDGTLNVSGDITQTPTLLLTYKVSLLGGGKIDCSGNLFVGDASAFLTNILGLLSNTLTLESSIATLHIAQKITVTGTTFGISVLTVSKINGTFSLIGGTTVIDGQILTTSISGGILNSTKAVVKFSIDAPSGSNAILKLTNLIPVDPASLAASIDFYNSSGTGTCTVEYAYSSTSTQTVYSTINSPAYLDISPALYQNLTFSGTGLKLAAPGLITAAGTIDNSASSPIDFVTNTNTVQLTGTNQSVIGGAYINTSLPSSPVGTVFYNLTSSATTTTLTGRNNIAALGTLAFAKNGSIIAMTVDANAATSLTLLSNSNGDASIASLSKDAIGNTITATINGNINVQRFVTGVLRRYMLLSSPVNNVTPSTYNLVPLKATTFITGPSGAANGFDNAPATGNSPSVFVYDENAPTSANVNSTTGNEYKPFTTINESLPLGNGVMYYFRGSRSIANPFIPPFPAPDPTTLNFFGAVFKGTGAGAGTTGQFTANILNFPGTPPSTYTTMAGTAALSFSALSPIIKRGLNLLGNPYASVIDLQKVYSVNLAINASYIYKFYYMLVKEASTGPNSYSTKFAVYDASTGSLQSGANRFALSGQGFFISAPGAYPIVFNETMKVPYSSYTGSTPTLPVFNFKNPNTALAAKLAFSPHQGNMQEVLATATTHDAASGAYTFPTLRLELNKDTSILNTTDINFVKEANNTFKPGEDAPYLQSSGQGDLLYSLTADSIGCFVNYMSVLEKLKRVNLIVTFSNYGLYKLTAPSKSNINERYTIFLKDKFTNDSLDVVHNPEYSFNVTTNKASYAHDRFYLSIGIAPGHDYKLLGFNGTKVTSGLQLNWKTDNESNFTKFVVEKSTNGGKSFIAINSLQSTDTGNYTFIDPAPGTGQITYRLAQTLVTGDTQFSKNLNFDYSDITKLLTFMVYPSNAAQDIHIRLGKTYSNNIKINIVSANGSMVKTITANNTDAIQQNVGNLIKGLYIVEAIDEATGKRIGSAKFFRQ